MRNTRTEIGLAIAAIIAAAIAGFAVFSRPQPGPAPAPTRFVSPVPSVSAVPSAQPTLQTSNCHYRTAADGQALPDPVCTPGAIDPRVTQANIQQTICTRGYTATVRPPLSFTEPLKRRQMVAYGQDVSKIAEYELDHFEALEIGGAPASEDNLWVEPIESARVKDRVENAAREAVCAGRLSLADAQQGMARDWTALGRQLGVVQP